jgi:alkylation response protein AidB-like acyl-CoA dehydrogenase
MDFEYSAKTKDLQKRVKAFMDDHIYPNEAACTAELAANTAAGKRWTPLQTIEKLKAKAKAEGLWNLFLPVDSAAALGLSGRRPHQPGIRAAAPRSWAGAVGQRGLQLLGARHRQHGDHRPLRLRRASRRAGSSRCSKARSARPSR